MENEPQDQDFACEVLKYYRYLRYLILNTNFSLPELLDSPLSLVERKIVGEQYGHQDRAKHDSYKNYIKEFGLKGVPHDVAFSIMLATYATARPKKTKNELYEAIDQLDSYFSGTLNYDTFE